MNVHIRWQIRRDLPETLFIDRFSYKEEWGEADFLKALRERCVIGMVAEKGQDPCDVVGYMIYESGKRTLKVLRMGVHPKFRRMGVATKMVARLKEKLSSHRRTRLVFDVPESHLPAHLFLRKMGFRAEKVKRGLYGEEDGYRFVHALEVRDEQHA